MTPGPNAPYLSGDELNAALFERYCLGGATLDEQAEIEAWFMRSPEQRPWYAVLRERLTARQGAVIAPVERAAAIETIAQWARSHPALRMVDGREAEQHASPRRVTRMSGFAARWRTIGVWSAAAVILAIGLGVYMTYRTPAARHMAGASVAVPIIETATTHGQRATIRLADGTRVILGVESRIRYPRNFGETARELTLDGEAYFDVVHDSRMPFRVRTVQGVTEDVGTRFAVRAYTDDVTERVVVEEGKVAVGPHVILGAGDVAHVTANAEPVVQHGVRVGRLLSWTRGHLEFVNVPVRDALRDVKRWYGIDIRVEDDALARQTITASFQDVPVREVLDFMMQALEARLERRGDTQFLIPEQSTGHSSTGSGSLPSPRT